jgi:tetratricopeptide (TPR) repeat protein
MMKLRLVIVSILVHIVAAAAFSQSGWDEHTRTGEYAFARGDLKRAEAEFQGALEIAQSFPQGDRRLETSLSNLARLYEHESDYDKAQPLYQLLLAAQEMRLGTEDPALLDTLYAVARVSQPTGDLPTVESSLERYAAIAEESGEADPRQWWQALAMLARMETVLEKEDDALPWQRRASKVIADDPRATDEEQIILLESLAFMEIRAGEGREAEAILVRVAELRETDDEKDGYPRTMAAGAEVAFGAGEFETADRLAMKVLNAAPDTAAEATARKVLADTSWAQVNRGTDDPAILLAAADDNEELVRARDRLRALAVFENDQDAQTLQRLVHVEALRGQPGEAAGWQRRLIELPTADESVLLKRRMDLVVLLTAAEDYDAALAENGAALVTAEQLYGESSRQLVPVLEQRRDIYTRAGMKKDAKKARKVIKKLSR